MQKITTFLMFNDNAEEAINFYASIFKNSKIVSMMPGPGGTVMGGTLELAGQTFNAFNGGPRFGFAEGMSLLVNCEDQTEIDHYWERLTSDGGEESMCGWLKDKFGVSWQIVPTILGEMLQDGDPKKSKRVVDAFLKMKKFDIQALKDAYEGKTV